MGESKNRSPTSMLMKVHEHENTPEIKRMGNIELVVHTKTASNATRLVVALPVPQLATRIVRLAVAVGRADTAVGQGSEMPCEYCHKHTRICTWNERVCEYVTKCQ